MPISSAQARAARALLGLTQGDLAERSLVSVRTVANFELEERRPIRATLAAIERALVEAGVKFITADRHGGPGVRLTRVAR